MKFSLAYLRADVDIFVTFEGDNTVLLQLVAKGLLTDYRRQFEDLRAFTMLKFLATRADTALSELNPVVTRLTTEGHLRDPQFQAGAFADREDRLLITAARRLRQRISNGVSLHDAFHECQDHLVSLAKAHVERLILKRFASVVRESEASVQPVLKSLCDLFALSRLEADRAWFLESRYFAPAKSKAIREQVNQLCGEIRPDAVALVDAFGIPEALLPAPMDAG